MLQCIMNGRHALEVVIVQHQARLQLAHEEGVAGLLQSIQHSILAAHAANGNVLEDLMVVTVLGRCKCPPTPPQGANLPVEIHGYHL